MRRNRGKVVNPPIVKILKALFALLIIFVFVSPWVNKVAAEEIKELLEFLISLAGMGEAVSILTALIQKKTKSKVIQRKIIALIAVVFCVLIIGRVNVTFAMIIVHNEKPPEGEEDVSPKEDTPQETPDEPMINWSEDIYMFDYLRKIDKSSLDADRIIDILKRYTQRYDNGEDTRPVRQNPTDLETGPYGSAVQEANQYQEDRSKIKSTKLIQYSILLEIESRKTANEAAEEADNQKILGTLYSECYNYKMASELDDNMTEQNCLEKSLQYLISALSLAYCDEYNKDYIREIWSAIRENYVNISNLENLDHGIQQQAIDIANAIQKNIGF